MQEKLTTGNTGGHEDTGIPAWYEKTVLRALPCNPSQLFVYWELPKSTTSRCSAVSIKLFEPAAARNGETVPALEVPVDPQSQSCYVTVPVPGLSYVVELTAVFTGGCATLRSTTAVQLPQSQGPGVCPSEPVDSPQQAGDPGVFSTLPAMHRAGPAATTTPVNPSSWSPREPRTP